MESQSQLKAFWSKNKLNPSVTTDLQAMNYFAHNK